MIKLSRIKSEIYLSSITSKRDNLLNVSLILIFCYSCIFELSYIYIVYSLLQLYPVCGTAAGLLCVPIAW